MKRIIAAALLVALFAGPAIAQGGIRRFAALTPAQAVESLPQEIAGFRRAGPMTDFELRPNGAGLGAAVEYTAVGDGAVATVYVYSGRQTGLAGGADTAEAQAQLRQASREIAAIGPVRRYTVAAEAPSVTVPGTNGAPAVRCARLELLRENGARSASFACLGVLGGRFLKLRISFAQAQPGSDEARVLAFGRGIVAAAGG